MQVRPRLTRSLVAILTVAFFLSASHAQGNYANQTIKWDDYTYKFLNTGQMAQVLNSDGKVVGTILSMNGELQMMPLPGPDSDKLKKSFDDWKSYEKRAHGGSATSAAPAAPASPAARAAAAGIAPATAPGSTPASPANAGAPAPAAGGTVTFDSSNQPTVARPDGVTVAFSEQQVRIGGYNGQNYIVRHEKGNTSRLLRNAFGPTHLGTGVAGGEQYLVENGPMFYDSTIGGVNMANAKYGMDKNLLLPKQLSQVIVDAVAQVQQVPGHESYKPAGYSDIKQVSQFRLNADGSMH
jgi:hypothetical protein